MTDRRLKPVNCIQEPIKPKNQKKELEMNIKSVETKHIAENPFAGLCEVEGKFEPYYTCKIVTDNGVFRGKGETKAAAHQDAIEDIQVAKQNEIREAISKYNADQGVYFVDC